MSAADDTRLVGAAKIAWLRGTAARRTGPHRFTERVCHWPYCSRCGLVLLRNDVSRRAAGQPCVWEE